MTTSSYHFLLGRSLLLLMGFNESTGVVSLDSGKLTRCQIQNPETRPRNLTGPLARGIASHHRNAMQNSDPKFEEQILRVEGNLPSRITQSVREWAIA